MSQTLTPTADGQLRADGPDRGAEVGAAEHRAVRRGPGLRHHVRLQDRRQLRALPHAVPSSRRRSISIIFSSVECFLPKSSVQFSKLYF